MNYKEEMKEIIDNVFTEAFKAGFKEGLKAKLDKSVDEEEAKKDGFWVGDEVKTRRGTIGVITSINEMHVNMVSAEGTTYLIEKKYLKRTGRKYPELERLFQKIKENNT